LSGDVESLISRALLIYGPLGVLALVAAFAAIRLHQQITQERRERDTQIDKMRDAHTAERRSWEERHVAAQEKRNEKLYELTVALQRVIDAFVRKTGGRSEE